MKEERDREREERGEIDRKKEIDRKRERGYIYIYREREEFFFTSKSVHIPLIK